MAFGAKVAAIEFAGDEVRVVAAKTGRRRPGLIEAHAATAVYESPDQRGAALAGALEAALEKLRCRPTAYVLCVDGARATVRSLTVPFRGRGRVAKAVPVELESHLPFPIDELLLDYCAVAEIGGETEVLTVGMRRKHVEEQLELLAGAGITPEAVNVDTAGLTALWRAGRKPSRGLEAVLHVRTDGSALAVTHQRTMAFFRHIPLGLDVLRNEPERFGREVQNTLRAFMAQWRGEGELGRIAVTGVAANEDLSAFSRAAGVAADPEFLLAASRGGAAVARRDGDGALGNRWEAALGVAMGASGADFSFDLLAAERKWEDAAGGLVPHLLFSACLGLLLVLGWGFMYHQAAARNNGIAAELGAQTGQLKTEIEAMALEGLGEDMDVTAFGDPTLLDVLKDISARMPESLVTVLEIKVAPSGARGPWITITGETASAAQFNTVFEELKKSALFKVADDTSIRLQGEKTTFRVRAFRPDQEISDEAAS